jgi:hypothetical protein
MIFLSDDVSIIALLLAFLPAFYYQSVHLEELTDNSLPLGERVSINPCTNRRFWHSSCPACSLSCALGYPLTARSHPKLYTPSTSAAPSDPSSRALAPGSPLQHPCCPGKHRVFSVWRTRGNCKRQTGCFGVAASDTVELSTYFRACLLVPIRAEAAQQRAAVTRRRIGVNHSASGRSTQRRWTWNQMRYIRVSALGRACCPLLLVLLTCLRR